MNAYTASHLALDAGVSVHVVRDYLLRGLLRPVACTTGGYGLFDAAALQRLQIRIPDKHFNRLKASIAPLIGHHSP